MATTTVGMPDPPQEKKALGLFARIVGVLFSPKATFEDITRRPSWLAPAILLTIIWFGLSATIVRRADWIEVTKQQIENNKFAARSVESLSADEKERVYEQGAQRSRISQYVRGVVGWPILILFSAGLNFGLYKLLTGVRTNFTTALAISSFAHLPMGLRELLAIPVTLLKDPQSIDPQNFLASNPAAFLASNAPVWQMILFGSLDLFSIWATILVAIGFSAADPKKVPIGKSLFVAFGTTYFIVLVFVMMAWIFL